MIGSMYIGNIHWKHCRLETSFAFGNMDWILETKIGYWKQKLDIGNIGLYIGNIAFGNIKMIMQIMHMAWHKR